MSIYVFTCVYTISASFSKLIFLLIMNKNQIRTEGASPLYPLLRKKGEITPVFCVAEAHLTKWKRLIVLLTANVLQIVCAGTFFRQWCLENQRNLVFYLLSFLYLLNDAGSRVAKWMGKGSQIGLPSQSKNSRWWGADIPFLLALFLFFFLRARYHKVVYSKLKQYRKNYILSCPKI